MKFIFAFSCISLFGSCLNENEFRFNNPFDPESIVFIKGGKYIRQFKQGNLVISQSVSVSNCYVSKYEVTREQWLEIIKWGKINGYNDLSEPSKYNSKEIHLPISKITWYDAIKWCNAKSEYEGTKPCYFFSDSLVQDEVYRNGIPVILNVKVSNNGYRLCTEAEWEFIARGGVNSNGYIFSGSNILNDVAWTANNSNGNIKQVGIKNGNEVLIHDMSGNVYEWCWDWYGNYSSLSVLNPEGPTSGTFKVVRGGAWDSDQESQCDPRARFFVSPNTEELNIGFRICKSF